MASCTVLVPSCIIKIPVKGGKAAALQKVYYVSHWHCHLQNVELLVFIQFIPRRFPRDSRVWNKDDLLQHCAMYQGTEDRAGHLLLHVGCARELMFVSVLEIPLPVQQGGLTGLPRLRDTASRTQGTMSSWVLTVTGSGSVRVSISRKGKYAGHKCCSNGM